MSDERPLEDTTNLFVGKTIAAVDASVCNKVQFLFDDGTAVALHIDCDWMGLPQVDTCTGCVDIDRDPVIAGFEWRLDDETAQADASELAAILAENPSALEKRYALNEPRYRALMEAKEIADAFADGNKRMAEEEGTDEGLVAGEETARFISQAIMRRAVLSLTERR